MPIDEQRFEYVGFWLRVWAFVVDSVLSLFIITPIVTAVYRKQPSLSPDLIEGPLDLLVSYLLPKGPVDVLVSYVLPAVAIVAFWIARQATPGKMVIRARIVDAETGARPTTGQMIGRYFAYYVSIFSLGLGFLWVAWDRRKQGWHDKLAGTVVVRERRASA